MQRASFEASIMGNAVCGRIKIWTFTNHFLQIYQVNLSEI